MMEQFQKESDEWERRHRTTWLGRHGGDVGTGMSMQTDLMSPFGVVEFIQRPSMFTAAKVAYTPMIGSMSYTLVGWMTGSRIGFAERVIHSADMAARTGRSVLGTWGHQMKAGIRALPGLAAMALVGAIGYYGSHAYGEFSGSAGIGDIRMFNR
jgi:hypothetical protein